LRVNCECGLLVWTSSLQSDLVLLRPDQGSAREPAAASQAPLNQHARSLRNAALRPEHSSCRFRRIAGRLECVVSNETDRYPFLLTVDEVAAAYLRTTRKGVWRMVQRGRIPSAVVVRVGRRVLFRRDRLVRWLSENGAPSPGDER
jgi:excisionase family DNA binding protein